MHDYDNYLYYDKGKIYKLTEMENELIDLFLNKKNKLITKDEICMRLYCEKYKNFQDQNIRRIICKIRKKYNLHISAITGRGYCLRI